MSTQRLDADGWNGSRRQMQTDLIIYYILLMMSIVGALKTIVYLRETKVILLLLLLFEFQWVERNRGSRRRRVKDQGRGEVRTTQH